MTGVERVPVELRDRVQWVTWRYGERSGKTTKIPVRPDGSAKASTTDPATWGTFSEAFETARGGGVDGVGFVFSADDDYAGVDLDGAFDDSGGLDSTAAAIVGALDSYTERSVSGRGLHVIVRARLNGGRHRGHLPSGVGLETYDAGRYFCMTGDLLHGCPATVEARQAELDDVLGRFLPPRPKATTPAADLQPLDLDDEELLERARAARNGASFDRLYRGDTAGYQSASEADLALCSMLAFWTGPDPARVDALFRRSGLMRPKWDTKRGDSTYGAETVARALEGRADFYRPPAPKPVSTAPVGIRENTTASDGQANTSVRTDWGWPDPLEAAYHGVAGEFVRTVDPHTEADPAAVLVTALVMFGNCLGRESYAIAEADRHAPALFTVIVGETSKGRKGSGAGQVRRLMSLVDPAWESQCIDSGLVSGEGLIWAIRDQIVKQVAEKEKGKPTGEYREEVVDEGVYDKRRLWYEGEFAAVIKAADRERNTLSAKIRDAWDGIDLRVAAKNSACRATRPHVSILGHITRDELRRHLTETESVNGFANRFLLCCARRSKELPEGGSLSNADLVPIAEQVRMACRFAAVTGLVERDDDARDLWRSAYGELSGGKRGLLGAATARAEAQVLRLSVLYALLDLSSKVSVEHLQAALDVWRYCERSAAWVFGDSLGDPVADVIVGALRRHDRGMTRTEIRDLFHRNQSEQIPRALSMLLLLGLARMEHEETGGRPAERWWAR